MAELTELEIAILHLERRRYKYGGMKLAAIWDELLISGTRYHQILNQLLDRPEALQVDAQLVNRLRRLRRAGTRSRWAT